jgi:hypothetical protein
MVLIIVSIRLARTSDYVANDAGLYRYPYTAITSSALYDTEKSGSPPTSAYAYQQWFDFSDIFSNKFIRDA